MSFSSKVKDELARIFPRSRHCQIAEITAFINMLGYIKISEDNRFKLSISTEHSATARKYFTLLKKTYNIGINFIISQSMLLGNKHSYKVCLEDDIEVKKILESIKLLDVYGNIAEDYSVCNSMVLSKSCCKRAYLRGAFLSAGSLSNPEKGYHFEISTKSLSKAEDIKNIINSFGLESKIILRKKNYVVYLKDSEDIISILGIMQAPKLLMEMENIRILKEMRNNVNRQVNCETANINRTIIAAVKQVEDIEYISKKVGLDNLPENLRDIAKIRLEYKDISLKDLGNRLSPPVGKSGVNHRLRKLSEFATKLRNESYREKNYD
jgi:hypothetical protein